MKFINLNYFKKILFKNLQKYTQIYTKRWLVCIKMLIFDKVLENILEFLESLAVISVQY